jgi:AcrR family transcriptional regulator
MQAGQPKWRRRKDARPGEIVSAALDVFGDKGFAAARLDDIAAQAGVSKGALYLYFETKEALFRAVVHEMVAPNVAAIASVITTFPGSFAELLRMVLPRAAAALTQSGAGRVIKMVVGEGTNFPELARAWHDEIISPTLGAMRARIERAQAEGEVRNGDARYFAYSLIGPMLLGVIWREVLEPAGAEPIDLEALARQHAEAVLAGMLTADATRDEGLAS